MPQKIKSLFRNLLEGAMMLTVYPDDGRRFPLDGGGFRQYRANMRGDVRNAAQDMRRAVHRLKEKQMT